MNTILKNTISITVITLVAGLALGVVQDITAGPIATQAEKSKEEAYKAVFEDASSFSEYSLDDTNQAEDLVAYLNDNGFTAQTIDEIMVAEDASGETLGYAFTITDSEGYGGDIQFAKRIFAEAGSIFENSFVSFLFGFFGLSRNRSGCDILYNTEG